LFNAAHVALNRLKLAAARHLPGQGDFSRFFGGGGFSHNSHAYDRFVAPHLDATALELLRRNQRAVFMEPIYASAADIVDEKGSTVPLGGGGYLVLKRPWPSIARTIWGDPDRYVETYFSKYGPEIYVAGDGAKRDEEGYFWLLGRIDDVMNVAGHRLSTYEIESALVDNPKVAEAAVVSRPDDVVGEAIVAFVTLKSGFEGDDAVAGELRDHVAHKIGKIARPHGIIFTADLPKTRSGKIMRRLLRDVARGRPLGDVTTLANAEVVEQIHEMVETGGTDE